MSSIVNKYMDKYDRKKCRIAVMQAVALWRTARRQAGRFRRSLLPCIQDSNQGILCLRRQAGWFVNTRDE